MAYYYVKTNGVETGTATGDGGRYASQKTGDWTTAFSATSEYYPTIAAAMGATTTPTSGDFICLSDAHVETVATNYAIGGPTSGNHLYIVSVDDTNCDTKKKAVAAQLENTGGNNYIEFQGRLSFYGVYIKAKDNFSWVTGAAVNAKIYAEDSTFEVTGTGDFLSFTTSTRVNLWYRNCDFIGVSGAGFYLGYGATLEMHGCTVTGLIDLLKDNGGYAYGANNGAFFRAVGCDLSSITGAIQANSGSDLNDASIITELVNCKLNATEPSFATETFVNLGNRFTAVNTSGSSGAAEYQYHVKAHGGVVDDETSFYRDGSTAFPSGTKISLKCTTSTSATPAAPLWFDFPTRYSALSSTSTDNLTLYILTSATLYDSDVWAEVVYPDGTNKQTPNYISTRHTDIMDTNGTALTTNTESWTGRTTENRYQIDIDTSTDAGSDCVPFIRVYVAKPSTTIYFCPTIGLS